MATVRKALGTLIVALLALSIVHAQPAAADDAGDEAAFLANLNDLRSSKGIGSLAPNSALATVARTWSATMAAANAISHNSSLSSVSPPNWAKLGENVGMGMDVPGLHVAFVNSPTHYRNMVDPAFDSVGIGVVRGGDGTLFVTVDFMTTKTAPAAAAPSPAPAPAPAPTKAAPAPAPAPRPAVAPVATPAPAAVPAPAPAPVVAPAPVEPATAPAPAPEAPVAEPVTFTPAATPVTAPARRTAMVAMHSTADNSPRTAVALVCVGLLLTVAASALVIPKRSAKAPSLARRY